MGLIAENADAIKYELPRSIDRPILEESSSISAGSKASFSEVQCLEVSFSSGLLPRCKVRPRNTL